MNPASKEAHAHLVTELARLQFPDVEICVNDQGIIYLTHQDTEVDLPEGLDRHGRYETTIEILQEMQTGDFSQFESLVRIYNRGWHAGTRAN